MSLCEAGPGLDEDSLVVARVGLAPFAFSFTTFSCLVFRFGSLAPEPSWVLELAELGGLLSLVMIVVLAAVALPPPVC